MVEVLRQGYWVPFVSDPPLSAVPIPLPSYSPLSIKGKAPQGEIEALIAPLHLPVFTVACSWSRRLRGRGDLS